MKMVVTRDALFERQRVVGPRRLGGRGRRG